MDVFSSTYHVRAYATNEEGTDYSDDLEFLTLDADAINHEGTVLIYNGTIIKY